MANKYSNIYNNVCEMTLMSNTIIVIILTEILMIEMRNIRNININQ